MKELIIGDVIPRLWTPPKRKLTAKTSKGFELCRWVDENLDIELMPHQRWLYEHLLELTTAGHYRFRTALVLMARQNAKTTSAQLLTLWRLLEDGARLIVGTSTNLRMASETWRGCIEIIDANPALRKLFRPPLYSNGKEKIEAKNGARYLVVAANERAGRGFAVDCLLLDELRTHRDFSAWSALSKTTNAKLDGMRLALSNAGDDSSIVLNHLRSIAQAATDPGVGLFEWSAIEGCAIDSLPGLRAANPALGRTITVETLRSDMATDPPAVFRTEVLCIRVQNIDALFDLAAWNDMADPSADMSSLRARVCVAVDVALDLSHVSLVAAATNPTDGRTRVEVVEEWPSVEAARDDLAKLLEAVKPVKVAWLPGPAAGALAVDLRLWPGARQMTSPEMTEACSGLVEQVASRKIIHPGDPMMTAQLAAAQRHPTGEALRFTRVGGNVDAVYGMAAAVWLARSLPDDTIPIG